MKIGNWKGTSSLVTFRGLFPDRPKKGQNRGAHRNVYQKTAEFKSPSSDESRKPRRQPDYLHRPNGEAATALWSLPKAMLRGSQRGKGAGMEGPVDEKEPIDSALPYAASGLSPVRSAGGGGSLGRALGPGNAVAE